MESQDWFSVVRQKCVAGLVWILLSCPIIFPAIALAEPDTPARAGPAALDGLVREALARSPILTAARDHWQALTKVPIQVATLPDPTTSLQQLTVGSPQPFSGYESSNFYYTGFGISQDIPGPGKLGLRARQAAKGAEAARDGYAAQQREVAEQVRESCFNLFYLQKVLVLLRETQADLRRAAHTAETQYRVGAAQQQDVLKAQLAQTAIVRDVEVNREEFQQAQAALKALLGRGQDSRDIEIADTAPSRFAASDRELRHMALANSPVLQQAQAVREQSDAALAGARRDYVPDFNLSYAYEKTGPGFGDYYMLTLGVKLPLYFWRKQTPAIEQAALEMESAAADSASKRLSVLSDLQNQVIALRTTDRVLKLYSDGLIPQAEETLISATAGYRVGKVDFQTLLSALIDVSRVKQEYFRTLADHEIAIAKIQQMAGEQP